MTYRTDDQITIEATAGGEKVEATITFTEPVNLSELDLKTDADGIKGTPTPTSEMKDLTAEDRLELRHSLDKVKGLA